MKRIILRDWEARAFYAGRLTQLRRLDGLGGINDSYYKDRIEKVQLRGGIWNFYEQGHGSSALPVFTAKCPLGGPGSRLWVAETWAADRHYDGRPGNGCGSVPEGVAIEFRADPDAVLSDGKPHRSLPNRGRWRSPSTMPRWASRSIIELTSVRVERVQDVTEEEARRCAVERVVMPDRGIIHNPLDESDEAIASFRNGFQFQWECDFNLASWDRNDWVWVRDLRRVER